MMELADYGASEHVDTLMRELARYDLYSHVVELEAYGMTVVPPEKMGSSPDFIERLRGAILRTCEKRNDLVIGDFRTANPPTDKVRRNTWDLLEEDEVFVEAATNPVQLALVRWLCGQSAVFSGQTWIIKGQGGPGLNLHSDAHGIPPGAGHIAHMCNASWICTDYESGEDGPTVFVPGSHRYGRATLPHESDLSTTSFKAIPLIAKAGSLAIWNGATWHAALPRTKPGLRITLVQNFMRTYMRPQHLYETDVSPQLLQKHPELERIIGKALYPYADSQNPDRERIAPFMRTGTDPFA
ncbi:MAG: phytanoyl-CoA dioxygenase family protein [Pseudomonadales bacterium]